MKVVRDVENLEGKKVFLRVDFNVAVQDGKVGEKFKIEAARETLEHLLSKKCKVALVSHLGRPEGKVNPEFSLGQIASQVGDILGKKIVFVDDCIGEKVGEALDEINDDEVLLLENVRFYSGEETNDKDFAEKLTANFDVFINDAFSVSHRDQASVTGVTEFLPGYAGFRLEKEILEMEKIRSGFARPAIAIIGGAKIETKLPVIKFFEEKYDFVLVGGKIANEALDQKIEFGEKVILPLDFSGERLDIGKGTIEKFREIISGAKTIVWNGPLGKFEEEAYAAGTNEILSAVLENGDAYTLVGGGETLEILEDNQAMGKISFVSTGGGAMLEYLTLGTLPGIKTLEG